MKRTLLVYGSILVFLAATAGLVIAWRHFTRGPSTVLTGPCDPPCWYGIRPGEMTSLPVLNTLMELPWVTGIRERMSNFPVRDELVHLAWAFKRPAPDAYGFAYFDDDVCTAVSILTHGSLTIAGAFGRFGEPELVWLHTDKADAREWVEVTLLYPADGIVVEVDVDLPAGGSVDSVEILDKTPVWRVTYFHPDRFHDLLDTEILINQTPRARSGELTPWPGLGAIPYRPGPEP